MMIFGLNLSTTDLWLLGISGTLIMTLIGYRFTISVNRRNSFNIAAKELIDTFHRELKEIYPIPANWPDNIDHYLRDRFDNLSEAIGKFKRHLPKRKQKGFDEAWFRFYCCTGREVDKNCQCYHHYMQFSGVIVDNGKEYKFDNTKTYNENLKKNVDDILRFAKYK